MKQCKHVINVVLHPVNHPERRAYNTPPSCLRCRKMVRRVARHFLTDELDRQYYADNYTCRPPPVFVPAITLIEVSKTAVLLRSVVYEKGQNPHVVKHKHNKNTYMYLNDTLNQDRAFRFWKWYSIYMFNAESSFIWHWKYTFIINNRFIPLSP